MRWTSVNKKLPPIGKEVWCFYLSEGAAPFDIYCVGKIKEIITRQYAVDKAERSIVWVDDNNDPITPTHWMYPVPPKASDE